MLSLWDEDRAQAEMTAEAAPGADWDGHLLLLHEGRPSGWPA